MCFKKPKMPEPTAEEIAAERRTREAISRATGTYGFRSLISGRKGGQGFMSRGLLG